MMKIDGDDPVYPEFKKFPSHAGDNKSNKKVSSRFLAIECRDERSAAALRTKLMIAYSNIPTKVDPILGAFIPFDAKFTDLEIFRCLVRRQNQYLAHYRNIPLNGLDGTILQYLLPNGNDLANEIQLKAQVFRIDPSAYRDHLGRYNLSTTADHYEHAIEWLDVELPKILEQIPEDKRDEFKGCVERIVAPVRSSKSVISSNSGQSSVKSYLSVLTSFSGADDSDDDDPPQLFRNKKSAPQLTFDFDDSSNFPSLPTKISASAAPVKPSLQPSLRNPHPLPSP
jgi:hypothetical protein